jgi:hypothetical protein
MTGKPTALDSALTDLTRDNKVQILLAAYQKHASELGAIEQSQETLDRLLLGIYSAGLTAITAFAADIKTRLAGPSPLAWTLTALAIMVGVYGLYMTMRRGDARRTVRDALVRVEQALGFYADGAYLQGTALYRLRLLTFPSRTFLDWNIAIVIVVGLAFVAGVIVLATP